MESLLFNGGQKVERDLVDAVEDVGHDCCVFVVQHAHPRHQSLGTAGHLRVHQQDVQRRHASDVLELFAALTGESHEAAVATGGVVQAGGTAVQQDLAREGPAIDNAQHVGVRSNRATRNRSTLYYKSVLGALDPIK